MSDSASRQQPKQQIIDQLKDVENVLVTVNRNPTVDELSAALGLTLLINKLNKHATAVFSGDIPLAITFLDPEKTFENTVDSLRDFIIALDKEKADHLRYKVDGDMVKIFITPYRTTISDKDLEFSQGDYNVEMVIAIGVQDEKDFDYALSDHGRIMHDAVVASIGNGSGQGKVGTIAWDDSRASSYSEMVATLADGLRQDRTLIDEQIATAFLTGIVAATERFSNERTTSQSMTVAAELMAAGANQQLIASQLESAEEIPSEPTPVEPTSPPEDEPVADDAADLKVERDDEEEAKDDEPVKDKQAPDGTISISHEKHGDVDEVARQTLKEQQAAATAKAEEELAQSLAASAKDVDKPTVADLQNDLKSAADDIDQSIEPPKVDEAILPPPTLPSDDADESDDDDDDDTPTFGGVLNATSEQAAEDKRRTEDADRNKTILSHDSSRYVGNPPASMPALNSYDNAPSDKDEAAPASEMAGSYDSSVTSKASPIQPLSDNLTLASDVKDEPVSGISSTPTAPTLADIDQQNRAASPYDDAQAAVAAALGQPPAEVSVNTDDAQPSATLPPLPPMPDFSTLPPLPNDAASLPPVPQTPEEMLASAIDAPATPPLPPAPGSDDPGQFRIPGQ